MTLEQQLREILSRPDILPTNPLEAISGSDLWQRCKPLIADNYAYNSYLQTFSQLSKDPTAPIARKEAGIGYYRRPAQQVATENEISEPLNGAISDEQVFTGRDSQPEEKFRAFYFRYLRLDDSFPVHIEHTLAVRRQAGVNKWKFPDLVVLDWDVGENGSDGYAIDKTTLLVKQGLGEQPFRLTSVELKIDLTLSTLREYFFQCVSNSKWAHSASLVIACSVSDSLLADELRRLGTSYDIAVSTFGFDRGALNELPAASVIMKMSDKEFEELVGNRSPNKMTSGMLRPALDWDHIRDLKAQSSEVQMIFDWIAYCLKEGKAYSAENYRQLMEIQNRPG